MTVQPNSRKIFHDLEYTKDQESISQIDITILFWGGDSLYYLVSSNYWANILAIYLCGESYDKIIEKKS